MRAFGILALLCFFFTISCNSGKEQGSEDKSSSSKNKKRELTTTNTVRNSVGAEFEILVVGENISSNQEFQDTLKVLFAKAYPAIPQPESWFRLSIIDLNNFNYNEKGQKSILFIHLKNKSEELEELMEDVYTETVLEQVKASEERFIKTINVFAKPQHIGILSAKSISSAISLASSQRDELIDWYDRLESTYVYEKLYSDFGKNEMTKKLSKEFPFQIKVPENFEEVKFETSFAESNSSLSHLAWYRADSRKSASHIMLYSLPLPEGKNFNEQTIRRIKNMANRTYVDMADSNVYMTIEDRLEVDVMPIEVQGRKGYELRGLWKVENDFKGGPFITRAVLDEDSRTIYIADGFIYAPTTRKKAFAKRIETALSTLSID